MRMLTRLSRSRFLLPGLALAALVGPLAFQAVAVLHQASVHHCPQQSGDQQDTCFICSHFYYNQADLTDTTTARPTPIWTGLCIPEESGAATRDFLPVSARGPPCPTT